MSRGGGAALHAESEHSTDLKLLAPPRAALEGEWGGDGHEPPHGALPPSAGRRLRSQARPPRPHTDAPPSPERVDRCRRADTSVEADAIVSNNWHKILD